MAAGYDISASAASGISDTLSFYNQSGISFGNSKQVGGTAEALGGNVTPTASRQQNGSNQPVADQLLQKSPDIVSVTDSAVPLWVWIAGGAVLLIGGLFLVLKLKK